MSIVVLSIDVGISNLSYCLLEYTPTSGASVVESTQIQQWETISLAPPQPSLPTHTCCGTMKSGAPCTRPASYMQMYGGDFFCKRHTNQTLIARAFTTSKLQKQTIPALSAIWCAHAPPAPESTPPPQTKKKLIADIQQFVRPIQLLPIPRNKAINNKHLPMHILAKTIIAQLNERFTWTQQIDHVVIENQIGPLAAKMLSVQAQLTMYFTMRGYCVQGVSSTNKLKDYVCTTDEYSDRKQSGVSICMALLTAHYPAHISTWEKYKKKDDLADGLLQGLWFIRHFIAPKDSPALTSTEYTSAFE